MNTKADPSTRALVADALDAEIMKRLDELGVMVLSRSRYSHLLETLDLHKQYLDLIRDLRDGHESMLINAQAVAHSWNRRPTPSRPSGDVPAVPPVPPPNDTGAQPSGHQP